MEKLYPEKPEKSREKEKNPFPKTQKTSPTKVRWDKAVKAVSIVELLKHLELQKNNEPVCPYCQSQSTLEVKEEEKKFRCTSCKKKGTSVSLIRKVKGVSNWEAIAYLENLAAIRKQEQEQKQNQEKPQPPTPTPSKKPQRSSRIPEEELEQLKRGINLEEVIRESGIAVKRQGSNLLVKCPFHNDKNASLSISNNLWHCFGCGKGGSVIDWVMENQRVEFRQAVDILREKYPSLAPIPQQAAKPVTPKEVSPDNQPLLKRTIHYYHQTLKQNSVALEYLKKRGIDNQEAIDYFKIGFAQRGSNLNLPPKTQQEGKRLREQLSEIGILRATGHEHFAGSIVIPIINEKGEVTEVYGRKIHDKLRVGTVYHLYLPGPHKGIFNRACLSCKEIILCESLIDALSLWVIGYRNVTSSYGVHGFTQEILQGFISHKVEKVFIAYDADKAGDQAASKVAKKLFPHGIATYRITFPWGLDANEFILRTENPKEEFRFLIEKAKRSQQEFIPLDAIKEAANKKNPTLAPNEAVAQDANYPLAAGEQTTKGKNEESVRGYVRRRGEEVEFAREDRIYWVRGLYKNRTFDTLRITLRVQCGKQLYFDSLDLYNAPRRLAFAQSAGRELSLKSTLLRADLTDLTLELERIQQERLKKEDNPKPTEVVMSKQERAAAEDFLNDSNLIGRITKDFKRCGLVGEEDNALILYLCMTSHLMTTPLALIIQSFSAAGKTTLMNFGLNFMPPEVVVRYTAMSGQSLFYMGQTNLKNKILAISEEKGAERATYPLKIMQSEGELYMASAGKDSRSGRFTTHEYRVEGPVAIMLATTAMEIDEELANRCLFITADEEREQTQQIQEQQRQSETLENLLEKHEIIRIQKLHQNAQRLLKPLAVVNPYARYLTFPDHRVRYRRDQPKYLALIRASALLHQKQRKKRKYNLPTGEVIEYVEVDLEDIALANRLFTTMMGECLDEMPAQTRKLLLLIHTMVCEHCQLEEVEQSQYFFTRKTVREYTGWHNTQLKLHLDRLVDMEHLLIRSGKNGQRYLYELTYQGQGQDGSRFTPGLIDVQILQQRINREFDADLSG